jgi:hypothetical protein
MSVARAVAGTAPSPHTVTLPSGAPVLRRSDRWPGCARRDPTRNGDERDREQALARSVRYRSSSLGSQVEPHGSFGGPAKARLTTRRTHAIRSRARDRLPLRRLEPDTASASRGPFVAFCSARQRKHRPASHGKRVCGRRRRDTRATRRAGPRQPWSWDSGLTPPPL